MDMKAKVAIGVTVLVLTVTGYITFSSIVEKRDLKGSIAMADDFLKGLYVPGSDISAVYDHFLSEGFKALQTKGTVAEIRDGASAVVGNYLSHSGAKDVTNALAPGAPNNIHLISFDVAYENEPEGRMIVTMIKEKGKWWVRGFNINSPKLTEAEMSQRIIGQAPMTTQNETR